LFGCLIVLGLFAGFGIVGFHIARNAPDRYGMLLAAGVTTWVVGQAAINLAAVVALLPVSGITLPFLSAGGSSLVFSMAGAGLLANIARQTSRAGARRPAATTTAR
jgi:cell division protein FtsW